MGSGNLHNKLPVPLAHRLTECLIVRCGQVSPRFRGQGPRRCTSRASLALVAGRAASLLARRRCADEHHGPLAQLVRAHG